MKRNRLTAWLLGVVAIVLLTITYWTNCIDYRNPYYEELAANSEYQVLGTIYHKYRGGSIPAEGYGLGLSVPTNRSEAELNAGNYLTDESRGFIDGYCAGEPTIAVANNDMDRVIYVAGNVIEFVTGIRCTITEVTEDENYLYVQYDSDEILNNRTGGTLELVRVCDANGNMLLSSIRGNYMAQYGLHGKVFAKIGTFLPILEVKSILRLLCSAAMAVVAVGICVLLYKKYDLLMAGVFFAVFLLSPWIVGFAPNIYWIEALLFFPMLVGLWCAIGIEKRWVRVLSYIAVFGGILIKCLCGYEYITVVMMSSIVFLLTDTVTAFIQKADRKKKILLIRTIFFIGVCALLGFATALCIHARVRGNGNVAEGLSLIYEQDVLRRTLGGEAANFDPVYEQSLNASILSVIITYFDFGNSPYGTQIILGISGKLFPVFALVSVVLVIVRVISRKKIEHADILYFWMFLSCITWFVLGKAHSAVHTHLNYLMWYFGYVQMMLYVVCQSIGRVCRKVRV